MQAQAFGSGIWGKVCFFFFWIHPRQKYVYIKNWKKVYLFVSYLICSFWWTFLSDMLAKVLLWFLFPLFSLFFFGWCIVSDIIYTHRFHVTFFLCAILFFFSNLASEPMRVGWFVLCILHKKRGQLGDFYIYKDIII